MKNQRNKQNKLRNLRRANLSRLRRHLPYRLSKQEVADLLHFPPRLLRRMVNQEMLRKASSPSTQPNRQND